MNEISKRLQQYYERSGLSYTDLAARTGVPKSALQRYISGTTEKIPMDRLEKLAYALDTTPQILMGWQPHEESDVPPGFIPVPEMRRVPLVGRIACGSPITAEQNIEDYVEVPILHHADFALRCEGDSMIDAGIADGDIVYIRRQTWKTVKLPPCASAMRPRSSVCIKRPTPSRLCPPTPPIRRIFSPANKCRIWSLRARPWALRIGMFNCLSNFRKAVSSI